MSYVVDANIAIKTILQEELSEEASEFLFSGLGAKNTFEKAQSAAGLYGAKTIYAPNIILHEMTNAVWRAVREKRVGYPQARKALQEFRENSGIIIVPSEVFLDAALEITKEINHDYIFDCIYLAIAIQQNSLLITSDKKFAKKLAKTKYKKYVKLLQELRT